MRHDDQNVIYKKEMYETRRNDSLHVSEYAKCPVCVKDSIIDNYDLGIRFLQGFITWVLTGAGSLTITDWTGKRGTESSKK